MRQSISFLLDRKRRSVAYSTVGHGRPLIVCETGFVTHLEALWSIPANRHFLESLAAANRVIRFDIPGVGLGDPSSSIDSFDERVEIFEDVVDGLGFPKVDFFATSQAGPAAMAYAARHPDRVRRLVLFGTFADGTTRPPDVVEALRRLCLVEWGLASGTLADIWVPDGNEEGRRTWAKLMRSATTGEKGASLFAEAFTTNVTALLPRIQAPTLVLHRRDDRAVRFERAVEIASGIPNARLVSLEGSSHLLYVGDVDAVLAPTVQFLADEEPVVDGLLTERELEVSTLVAQGLTNAEIAVRLYVSPRTVEAHLEHVRDKLGMRSRAQIAAWVTQRLQPR